MYKPILLGINNASPGGLLVLFGILIFILLSLIAIAGVIVYFTGYYIVKSIRWMRKPSTKK
jgi:hypothetical protein